MKEYVISRQQNIKFHIREFNENSRQAILKVSQYQI